MARSLVWLVALVLVAGACSGGAGPVVSSTTVASSTVPSTSPPATSPSSPSTTRTSSVPDPEERPGSSAVTTEVTTALVEAYREAVSSGDWDAAYRMLHPRSVHLVEMAIRLGRAADAAEFDRASLQLALAGFGLRIA